jgi:DNA-binding IclR family transcriptional regulator
MADDAQTVLGKAVAVLRAFSADDTTLSLAALTARTGLAKTSVHRLARDLVHHGLLDRDPLGYRLSSGLFELGMRAAAERTLLELAMPFLQDLYERTRETVHLGVRDGHDVVYVAKIGGHRQARSPSRTGGRLPLHCTAIGKVLLAYAEPPVRRAVLRGELARRTPHTIVAPGLLRRQLAGVVEQGVAFEHEESAIGLVCLAAPVLTADDRIVAAVSVAGPVGRFAPPRHTAAIRAAAAALGNVLDRRSP